MVLNLKVYKKNLVTIVQAERPYVTIYNLVGTTSILKTDADYGRNLVKTDRMVAILKINSILKFKAQKPIER